MKKKPTENIGQQSQYSMSVNSAEKQNFSLIPRPDKLNTSSKDHIIIQNDINDIKDYIINKPNPILPLRSFTKSAAIPIPKKALKNLSPNNMNLKSTNNLSENYKEDNENDTAPTLKLIQIECAGYIFHFEEDY